MGRVIRPEMLETASDADAARNLADIAWLNRWFGVHAIVRRLLGKAVEGNARFSMLDVGAGSGDIGRAMKRRYPDSVIVSMDHSLRNLSGAAEPRLAGDAFRLPFVARSFDVVFCGLFLHHFPDDTVASLLASFGRVARRAVIVLDLERGPLARRFLPATRRVFSWHPMTVHDGVISVNAAFTKEELETLAARAGLDGALVQRHRPWARLSLVAPR
jgi:SAM-dependent methyltransferase